MPPDTVFETVPSPLAGALTSRGFTALTSVQEAVLAPEVAGKDLRISSQTGSGKTVALGLAIASDLTLAEGERGPAAIVIAPTRELVAQIAKELTWLFQPLGVRVCSVTGGTSISGELRSLSQNPRVIVGTPGRLLDHLERKAIDASNVKVLVLDEADQMLDLGFREPLEAICGKMPEGRRTHLVSATFSREVKALADRYQKQAVQVEGTALGDANEDIDHVAVVVRSHEREAALRNLLLMTPGERTLVFVRTRAEASDLADRLGNIGFSACALSGELEQKDRTRRLDAFRAGKVLALIATDVAARGLDVPEVTRVIHADPPSDFEVLTHRSGRTGRAGKKGTAIVLLPPAARERVSQMYRRARIQFEWRPAPTPADVLRTADERLKTELTAERTTPPDARLLALATTLLADPKTDAATLVATLLEGSRHAGPCAPLPISPVEAEPARRAFVPRTVDARRPMDARRPAPQGRVPYASSPHAGPHAGTGGHAPLARPASNAPNAPYARPTTQSRPVVQTMSPVSRGGAFIPFRINWGQRDGADPRRMLALLCRRGGVAGNQIGAIRIGPVASTFEVKSDSANEFMRAASKPDARDPRVRIAMSNEPTIRA